MRARLCRCAASLEPYTVWRAARGLWDQSADTSLLVQNMTARVERRPCVDPVRRWTVSPQRSGLHVSRDSTPMCLAASVHPYNSAGWPRAVRVPVSLRGAGDRRPRGSCAPVVRTEFPIQRETRGEPYLRAGRPKGGPGPAIVSTTSSSAERTITLRDLTDEES